MFQPNPGNELIYHHPPLLRYDAHSNLAEPLPTPAPTQGKKGAIKRAATETTTKLREARPLTTTTATTTAACCSVPVVPSPHLFVVRQPPGRARLDDGVLHPVPHRVAAGHDARAGWGAHRHGVVIRQLQMTSETKRPNK